MNVGTVRDVEDALLEQVADPLGMFLEQPHRVVGLDVLREDKYPDLRMLRANRLGGDEAFVGVRRRHRPDDRLAADESPAPWTSGRHLDR
jgi:hypothetical protein